LPRQAAHLLADADADADAAMYHHKPT